MASLEPPRKPSRIPVCAVHANGRRIDLFTVTPKTIEALDVHMLGLDFGYITVRVAHGRVAGFDVMQTHRVVDDLTGQPPPGSRAAA